jgi:hypothetical protein
VTKTTTRARHRIVVDDGDWYSNDEHDNTTETVPTTKIEATTVGRGAAVAVLKITAGADNNQQRAAKTVVAAIAVGCSAVGAVEFLTPC